MYNAYISIEIYFNNIYILKSNSLIICMQSIKGKFDPKSEKPKVYISNVRCSWRIDVC